MSKSTTATTRPGGRWPLLVIGAPAVVAVWTGWVGLGSLCGFGHVEILPGITPWTIDTRITLPIGMEAYGVYALHHATERSTNRDARAWAARTSAVAFALGLLGQVAYHLMVAAGVERAPWPVTVLVSAMPVLALGAAAMLWHLLGRTTEHDNPGRGEQPTVEAANTVTEQAPPTPVEEANTAADVRPERSPRTAPNMVPEQREHRRKDTDVAGAYAAWLEREGTEHPMPNKELAALLGVSDAAARVRANRWRRKANAPERSSVR